MNFGMPVDKSKLAILPPKGSCNLNLPENAPGILGKAALARTLEQLIGKKSYLYVEDTPPCLLLATIWATCLLLPLA